MKKLLTLSLIAAAVLIAVPVSAATFINIPASSSTDLLAYVGDLAADIWWILAVGMGVPFGFYCLKKVAGILPKR